MFLHLCHRLRPDPPSFPCCCLLPARAFFPQPGTLPTAVAHHLPREGPLTPPSRPPLYILSRPCTPPPPSLITLRIYLCEYVSHVSPHQAANSVRVETTYVLLTDNPQCLAHSRASTFFKEMKKSIPHPVARESILRSKSNHFTLLPQASHGSPLSSGQNPKQLTVGFPGSWRSILQPTQAHLFLLLLLSMLQPSSASLGVVKAPCSLAS